MVAYIVKRLLWLIPVLLIVSVITFILMHNTPGGPWDRDLEARQVDKNTQELLNKEFGLDKPLWRQYVSYVIGDWDEGEFKWGLIAGNMGPSYRQRGRTVQDILFDAPKGKTAWQSKWGYSARLGLFALGIAIFAGIPIGIFAALGQNTWRDYLGLFMATAGISVPSFVMGIFLIIIFGSWLGVMKIVVKDWSSIGVWIVPAVVLGFNTTAYTARLTRSSMLEVMRQDYVRTARAKGLAERVVIFIHMLKNAMIPVVTILGPALAGLVTGSFIIETLFGFPGLGRAYITAIGQRDYSMILGTTIFYAILVALANLSVDLVYALIDPRIKLHD
jgi:oligopeptide transport system permease protein